MTTIAIIDTETNGLPVQTRGRVGDPGDFSRVHPVQVGMVLCTWDGRSLERGPEYSQYAAMEPGDTMDPGAEKVHGLSREYLSDRGSPRSWVMDGAAETLSQWEPDYIAGQNIIGFDAPLLFGAGMRSIYDWTHIDTRLIWLADLLSMERRHHESLNLFWGRVQQEAARLHRDGWAVQSSQDWLARRIGAARLVKPPYTDARGQEMIITSNPRQTHDALEDCLQLATVLEVMLQTGMVQEVMGRWWR